VLIGSPATHIVLAAGATDMRKSFDTLAAIVRNELGGDPISGHLFVFCNKRKDRIKVLYFDGSGLWVCAKRLEKGTFSWPETRARSVELRREELVALLGGLDLRTTKRRRWYRHAELSTSSAQAR
jgi:transposase